jgi:phenylacetate-CoA ligase
VVAANALLQPRFPFRAPQVIKRAQKRRLRETIAHAHRHVPYYRETMRRLGLRPTDFHVAADLASLPVIERVDVQRDPEYFVSTAFPLDTHVKLQTGGTGGAPLTFYRSNLAVLQRAAHRERARSIARRLAGARLRLRHALIIPPSSSTATGTGRRAFRQLAMIPSGMRATYAELSLLDPPRENVARLNSFRPDAISTYGSYLEALFLHLHETQEPFHRPKVVSYGSDALAEPVRRLITDEFGIQVLSAYHAVEAPPIGFECESHLGLHVNVDLCPVRIVDPIGRGVPEGESGDVVISNLVNRGTILLNYRLGDVARWLSPVCPCGRNLPLLSFIEGRGEEWLATASGEMMHPQGARMLVDTEEQISSYQVVQRSRTHFAITLVAAPGCDRAATRDRLARKFAGLFGDQTTVEVHFCESLPGADAGKLKSVVSQATT